MRELTQANTRAILPAFTTGLAIGLLNIIICISFAALIFSGELGAFLPSGIGVILVSSMLAAAASALFSHFKGAISITQDSGVVILALVAQRMASSSENVTGTSLFVTLLAFIALSTLITGSFFVILGRFKLGNLIRFIPYPVIGAFLGGMSIVFFQGAFSIVADYSFSFSTLSQLVESDTLMRWLPAVAFGIVLLVATQISSHYLTLPSLLVAGTLGFFVVILASGKSVDSVLDDGWMLGPFPEDTSWKPIFLEDLSKIEWKLILAESLNLPTIALVSAISLLLNISGLEVQDDGELEINQELQSNGFNNIVFALLGGTVSFPSISLTLLSWRMNGKSRITGLTIAALFLLILVAGFSLIAYFPKFVLGGLMIFLAISIALDWVYKGWFKMPVQDYLFMMVILFVMAFIGYLQGIAFGIVGATILFTYNYSRFNFIQPINGQLYHSKVERPPLFHRELQTKGESILIYRLKGFIFFGSANNLLDQTLDQIATQADSTPLRFLIVDFHQAHSIDSSAILTFIRLNQLLNKRDVTLIFCGLSPALQPLFERSDFDLSPRSHFQQFSELDEAAEWCENKLLSEVATRVSRTSRSFGEELAQLFPEFDYYAALLPYMERLEVVAGTYLAKRGDQSDTIYWVETGRLQAQIDSGSHQHRLRIGRGGSIMGEMAFYTGRIRSASIVATEASVVYVLSKAAVANLESQNPTLAYKFHRMMAGVLSERLMDTTNSLGHYL